MIFKDFLVGKLDLDLPIEYQEEEKCSLCHCSEAMSLLLSLTFGGDVFFLYLLVGGHINTNSQTKERSGNSEEREGGCEN